MKKYLILPVFILMLSLCVSVSAEQSPVYPEADTLEMTLISDNTLNRLNTAEGTPYVLNGDYVGTFYSDREASAVMTVSMTALADNRYAVIFFNQTKADAKMTYDNTPPIERALSGGAVKVTNKADAEFISDTNFKDYSFSVKIKEGINVVYIPKYEITDDCGNLKYTKDGVKCNSLVCFKSVKITQKELGKVTYIKDIPSTNLSHYSEADAVNSMFNKSYLGNDPSGYTNCYFSYEGAFVTLPFRTDTKGDYFLKVYYASCENNCPAVMHLDCDAENMPSVYLWQKAQNTQGSALDRQAAVQSEINKYISGSKIYKSGTWTFTGSLWDYVNNGAQSTESWMTYRKAPYFAIKTFELNGLSAGDHTASFIVQSVANSGKTDYYNNGLMINKIELIKKNSEMSVDVNTYVTAEPGERESAVKINGWDNGVHHITVLSDAKALLKSGTPSVDFSVEFINNTLDDMRYKCYIAQYNSKGQLIGCNVTDTITVAADKNVTLTRKYMLKPDELLDDASVVKMFVWDSNIVPAAGPTVLKDGYKMQDIHLADSYKLSEDFKQDIHEYSIELDNCTDKLGVISYCSEGAQISVNGMPALSGDTVLVSDLPSGNSQISVELLVGATKVDEYIINVKRPAPDPVYINVKDSQYKYIEYELNDGVWQSGYDNTASDGTKGIGGGGIVFKFNSPTQQKVTVTLDCWRGQPNADPIVVFFNPVATPDEYTYTMEEGKDYPPLSDAVLLNTTWSNGKTQKLSLSFEADAKKGENTIWIPSRALARNVGSAKTECMYIVNPKNTSSYANRQTITAGVAIQPESLPVSNALKKN